MVDDADLQTLPALFKRSAERYGDRPAFLARPSAKAPFAGPNWRTLYEQGLDLAAALLELGLQAKETVAVLADNRPEWILCDYGILMNGALSVPRAANVMDEEIKYILNHSEARFLIVEHEKLLRKILALKPQLPLLTHIIVMDPAFSDDSSAIPLQTLCERGKTLGEGECRAGVKQRCADLKGEDLFTLIYTSGTTGTPKGVMLSHASMVYMVRSICALIHLKTDDSAVSILPVWHIFERAIEYLLLYGGAATYYSNIRNLSKDLQEVKPTLMGSAPRLWESIYDKVMNKVERASPVSRALFKLALHAHGKVHQAERFFGGRWGYANQPSAGQRSLDGLRNGANWLLWIIPALLLRFIPAKLRLATGGNMRASISAGGALPAHVDRFFNDIGVPLLEGYGMTECCPAISVRLPEAIVLGTVGPPLPGSQVEIRDLNNLSATVAQGQSGVLFIKGPQMMQGYLKNDEATRSTILDGWLNTGDIARFNYDGTISITGRSKETVVLLSGENVEPVPIENTLLESPYLEHVMVVGQDKKFLGALLVLNEEHIRKWASKQQMADLALVQLIEREEVIAFIKKEVRTRVSRKTGFQAHEQISDFRIVAKPFEVDDELTRLFKIKRHVVTEKYGDLIAMIYD